MNTVSTLTPKKARDEKENFHANSETARGIVRMFLASRDLLISMRFLGREHNSMHSSTAPFLHKPPGASRRC
jgi:hypothetical protein